MDEQSQDPAAARRLPGAGEPPRDADRTRPGYAMTGRARGLRQVRRWSNWTAAALIAGTVLTTGYFVQASQHTAAAATGTTAAASAAAQPGTAAGTHQPCVFVPVVTSGGSGVTKQTVVRSCGSGTSSTTAPVVINTGRAAEKGDS